MLKHSPLFLLTLIIWFSNVLSLTLEKNSSVPPDLLILDLIHEHSVHSPSFDPKRTTTERADMDLYGSISRGLFLTANDTIFFQDPHALNIETRLLSRGVGFLAKLAIGEQNTKQLVFVDSGSSMLWINCEPCGTDVLAPIYDPTESETFEFGSCEDSNVCDRLGPVRISCKEERCLFYIKYPKYFSAGYLARDDFKFEGSKKSTLEGMVFGCAESTNMPARTLKANGILGLSSSSLSLISQMESTKFAYCIGNISDDSYMHNRLLIGDQIELRGDRTPVVIDHYYFITLEAITVGSESVNIDRNLFRRTSDYHGGMIVDTASTYSFLPKYELEKFEGKITSILDAGSLTQIYSIYYQSYRRLCYNGVITRDLTSFPTVRFQFEGDTTLEVVAENIFQQYTDDTFCFGFLPSELLGSTDSSILGNLMQQSYYVVIDIEQKLVSFQATDCSSFYLGSDF